MKPFRAEVIIDQHFIVEVEATDSKDAEDAIRQNLCVQIGDPSYGEPRIISITEVE